MREDFWPLNTTLYVKDFKGNDPRYISYLLRTIDFLAHSDKSRVPGVNRNHLHMAPVRVPTTAKRKC
jgi:type I restriction enzyme S subunit